MRNFNKIIYFIINAIVLFLHLFITFVYFLASYTIAFNVLNLTTSNSVIVMFAINTILNIITNILINMLIKNSENSEGDVSNIEEEEC